MTQLVSDDPETCSQVLISTAGSGGEKTVRKGHWLGMFYGLQLNHQVDLHILPNSDPSTYSPS